MGQSSNWSNNLFMLHVLAVDDLSSNNALASPVYVQAF